MPLSSRLIGALGRFAIREMIDLKWIFHCTVCASSSLLFSPPPPTPKVRASSAGFGKFTFVAIATSYPGFLFIADRQRGIINSSIRSDRSDRWMYFFCRRGRNIFIRVSSFSFSSDEKFCEKLEKAKYRREANLGNGIVR